MNRIDVILMAVIDALNTLNKSEQKPPEFDKGFRDITTALTQLKFNGRDVFRVRPDENGDEIIERWYEYE